jgi:uncharacterized membrane protein YeaQ/YmgE (transglycosylase-associated protein family)
MPLLLLFILIVFVLALFWLTAKIVGVIITLVIAGLVGALADSLVPGDMPFGWLGAILAGLVGSWVGVYLFDRMGIGTGIVLAGIPIIPAFVGALILSFVASLLYHQSAGSRRI